MSSHSALYLYNVIIIFIIYNMYLYRYLKELLFPVSCAGCGRVEGEMLCPECLLRLPLLPESRCARCASPTPLPVESCRECRRHRPAVDATVALAAYRDPLRPVIHRLKYGNGRGLAPLLAALLFARLREERRHAGIEAVTFVPMHPRRERERGYNQARLLAEALALHLGRECLPLLRRNRTAPPQTGLAHAERLANLRGCMEAGMEAVPERVAAGGILLVDDVFTTGATLSECALALKRAGAGRVTACVLARDLPTTH
jgi:ComF family protein